MYLTAHAESKFLTTNGGNMKKLLAVLIALSITLFAFCACENDVPDAESPDTPDTDAPDTDAPDTDAPDASGDGFAEDIDWGI